MRFCRFHRNMSLQITGGYRSKPVCQFPGSVYAHNTFKPGAAAFSENAFKYGLKH